MMSLVGYCSAATVVVECFMGCVTSLLGAFCIPLRNVAIQIETSETY